jgi:hypothetical protein
MMPIPGQGRELDSPLASPILNGALVIHQIASQDLSARVDRELGPLIEGDVKV